MIGRLAGTLLVRRPPLLVVDVNGVGYELEAPMSTFYALPEIGSTVQLHTHLVVRDDALSLFGFASDTERWLFRSLIRVNGVGPRLALTILSGMSVDGFVHAVQDDDVSALVRLPGVGRKTAERLVVEMRDRLDDGVGGSAGDSAARASSTVDGGHDPAAEAYSALVGLGYKPAEARRLLAGVETAGRNSEELIRHALRAAMPQ